MTIRLLLLIPTLDRSGAEKQFALLASRLPRDEFEVHVAALTRGGPYEADLQAADVPLTILHKRWKCDPFAYARLRRVLAEFQRDILHTWLVAANAYGRLAAGKNPSFKTIVSERCVDTWKSGWQLSLDRRLAPRTSALIGNSNSVADFYRQQGFPADRLEVISNGIAIPSATNIARDEILAAFNIPPGAKVVGFVGRLARQKRVKDLIWSMQLLRQLTDNVYFLIIGNGPERARLEELTRQLQCNDVTRFAGHRDDAFAALEHGAPRHFGGQVAQRRIIVAQGAELGPQQRALVDRVFLHHQHLVGAEALESVLDRGGLVGHEFAHVIERCLGLLVEWVEDDFLVLTDFLETIVVACLATTLFFGGWQVPFLMPDGFHFPGGAEFLVSNWIYVLLGMASFSFKVVVFCWIFMQLRWTVPRFRYDQLMSLGWKGLFPIAVANDRDLQPIPLCPLFRR